LDNEGIESCNNKSALYQKYKNDPSAMSKSMYIVYRNKLKSLLLKAEKDYYCCKFKCFQGNLRETWQLLHEVMHDVKNINIVKTGTFGFTILIGNTLAYGDQTSRFSRERPGFAWPDQVSRRTC